jgi:hypothetical protein
MRRLACVITAILCVGCGGGGGGPDPGPVEGQGDPKNYFPVSQGNTWNYQGTNSKTGMSSIDYVNSAKITGTQVVDGKTAFVLSEVNTYNSGTTGELNYHKDNNGITLVGLNDPSDPLTPNLLPYQIIKFPLQANSSFVQINKAGVNYPQDLDMDGKNETVSVYSTVTVKGFESVTVKLGVFPESVRIETNTTLTITLSSNNAQFSGTGLETSWYAPGVGLVKSTLVTTANNNTETETEELIGYSVDGQSKGIMPKFLVANGVAPANSDTTIPGRPAISYDGTNYLVVSRRVVDGSNSTTTGALVTENGALLKSFDIAPQGSYIQTVAFDGTNYLVVVDQNGLLVGRRISPSGTVLDAPNGFNISSDPSLGFNMQPAVAFDGANYMVVWMKYNNVRSNYDIYGAVVAPSGTTSGEFPISAAPQGRDGPRIAFDGNNYLVVWNDSRNATGPLWDELDIYGARVTKQGVVLDLMGIPISTAPHIQGDVDITFDGVNYFAVWLDERLSGSYMNNDIYGTRIQPDGSLLDGPPDTGGIAINTATYNNTRVSVTFDGINYSVVWDSAQYATNPPSGVFAARVSPGGVLVDQPSSGNGISISGLPPEYSLFVNPTIFSNGKNSLVTWINNGGVIGTSKDMEGVLIYPF